MHIRLTTMIAGCLFAGSLALAQETTPTPGIAPTKDTPAPAKDTTETEEKKAEPQKATVGKKAPAFSLKDTKGKVHSLSDFTGKHVVIDRDVDGASVAGLLRHPLPPISPRV